jgi:soluble lytic murein transglycosylase-like protein/Kef-type K+ transport system membrane component KefB
MVILLTSTVSAALVIWLSLRLCRRARIAAAGGLGIALSALAIAILLIPGDRWRTLADSESADRLLSAGRQIGVTGLLFIAGARLRLDFTRLLVRRAAIVTGVSLLVAGALAGCAAAVLGFDYGEALVTAAAIVGSSTWLVSQRAEETGDGSLSATVALSAALLSVVLFATVHLSGALSKSGGQGSAATLAVDFSFEAVKLAVFFSVAWLVATRFLDRGNGKLSGVRLTAGYLLITVLVFALAASWLGEIGAYGWSFMGGTLFLRLDAGRDFASRDYSAATSAFLALAFLPVFLQSHGRVATNLTLVVSSIAAALIAKTSVLWISARLAGVSGRDASALARAMVAPAETGVALLGVGMTKWMIDGTAYFIAVGFGVVSLLASLRRIEFRGGSNESDSLPAGVAAQAKARATSRGHKSKGRSSRPAALLLTAIGLTLVGTRSTVAQTQDPVVRAMRSIEQAADRAEVDARRTLLASKLVEESAAARGQGDLKRAVEALVEAERIGLPPAAEPRGPLAELLVGVINRERSKIEPAVSIPVLAPGSGTGLQAASRARLAVHGETIARVLSQEMLPIELISIALVESGLNTEALSPKGARGAWQLMPATARRYGLVVEPGTDQRVQIDRSTRAAARYLRDLYRQFQDWKLVLAAYNWGEERVRKAIQKAGTRDFDQMARRVFVPLETRRYVPAVLAAWSRLSRAAPSSEGSNIDRR